MNKTIEELVIDLSKNPFSPLINFDCAVEYQRLNQTASAVSFYLRSAEYGYDSEPEIVYTSLLKMAKCFEDQNDRLYTVTNCLLQAIAYLPKRPEAYFLMASHYEQLKQWQECYTWSQLGLECNQPNKPLPADVGYISKNGLLFQKAVSSWYIGRKDEGLIIFKNLSDEYKILSELKQLISMNIKMMEE